MKKTHWCGPCISDCKRYGQFGKNYIDKILKSK